MSITDPLIGKRLGDYFIEGVLGTGGMARVYRGYDDNLDRYAAIKVIEPQLIASADEDEYRERFLREARAIARLSHPRIVGIYQFNQIGNLYYIAMEYIEGRNLRDVLKGYIKQDRLTPTAELLKIVRDIAEALDYAHKNNIIHRDIKPSNIIITDEGNAVLTDFGLALNAVEGTVGNTFGSVHYIAPEQAISSAQAVPQSDQYSLGIVTYEMLTGTVPFDDASAMSVALKHISDPPPPPSELNPNIPPEVEQVVLRALDKDVNRRYSASVEFVKALEMAFAMSGNVDIEPGEGMLPSGTPPPTQVVPPPEIASQGARRLVAASKKFGEGSQPDPATLSLPALPASGSSRSGIFIALIVVAIVIIAGALIFFSGALGPDEDATSTAVALIAAGQTETAVLQAENTAAARSTFDVATSSAQQTSQAATGAAQQTQEAATEIAQQTASAAAQQTSAAETVAARQTSEAAVTIAHQTREAMTAAAQQTSAAAQQTRDAVEALAASETQSAAETATELARPTHTPEASPTMTPTAVPTNTPQPTATFTPELIIESEADPAQVLLRYDGRLLIIGNRDLNNAINIRDLHFVRLEPNEAGEFVETAEFVVALRFNSDTRQVVQGRCFQILDTREFRGLPDSNPLADDLCGSAPFWVTTADIFWVSPNRSAYFEVRLGPVDVLATCPINRPQTRSELRCVVNLNNLP